MVSQGDYKGAFKDGTWQLILRHSKQVEQRTCRITADPISGKPDDKEHRRASSAIADTLTVDCETWQSLFGYILNDCDKGHSAPCHADILLRQAHTQAHTYAAWHRVTAL
mmetsp:Transcript_127175/g.220034  ORF Transcript_127175/g.220034 Transcript_127175/m.220034 type:complete len:110 (-) Transcript_127175:85-414(-)